MATNPESYSFSMQSSGISFKLDGRSDNPSAAVTVTVQQGQTAYISLKALTIIIASLNHAKNKHTDNVE